MNHYSEEKKAEVLARLTPPENLTIPQLSQAEGISKTAIRNWQKENESKISSNLLMKRKNQKKISHLRKNSILLWKLTP